MKWWKQFYNTCKPVFWSVSATIVLLLVSWPLVIEPDGIVLGQLMIPLRTDSVITGAWGLLISMTLPLVSFLGILIFATRENRNAVLSLFYFQLLFLVPILITGLLKLGGPASALRFVFLYVAFGIVLNGFLLLFSWIFSSRFGAGVVMMVIQLTGPGLLYLGNFHDMIPGWFGKMGLFLYRELPFYQKFSAMWEQMDHYALWPDVSLGILILGFAWIVSRMDKAGAAKGGV